MTLELDEQDFRDVNAAIATWQARVRDSRGKVLLPDGDSDIRGAILAIICRGWLDSLDSHGAPDDEGEEWKGMS